VCTLALYFKVSDDYPIVVAANRDERYDRPSAAPQVISHSPVILAGKDLVAGGTWLGVNQHGLVVGILNRKTNHEDKPANFRSRGLLCLELLGFASAADAAGHLRDHQPAAYQPFSVVLADRSTAWVASNFEQQIRTTMLNKDLHVFSNASTDAERSHKRTRAYARFNTLLCPPAGKPAELLPSLATILSDHTLSNNSDNPKDAICVHGDVAGTVSSSVLVYSESEKQFHTFYCPGAPCSHSFSECSPIPVS
jgi:uncharacterized protein with NRDE domain